MNAVKILQQIPQSCRLPVVTIQASVGWSGKLARFESEAEGAVCVEASSHVPGQPHVIIYRNRAALGLLYPRAEIALFTCHKSWPA